MRRIDPSVGGKLLAPETARPIVLLTGFGPFPGVPANATSLLVPRLAKAARDLFPDHEIVADVLPTEWEAAPLRLGELLGRPGTVLALHFGVSKHAEGFQIELQGRNQCRALTDAAGFLPTGEYVIDSGPAALAVTLPAERIVARLVELGMPARTSTDAGGFLCNALLYHSLNAASPLDEPHLVGFVHLPADLVDADGNAAASAHGLDMRGAVAGALEIIAACLESLNAGAQ